MDLQSASVTALSAYAAAIAEAAACADAGQPAKALSTLTNATMTWQTEGQAFLKAWKAAENMRMAGSAAHTHPDASPGASGGGVAPSGVARFMVSEQQ